MSDRLLLHDIQAMCRLGVYEWEQKTPQPIWISLELPIDAAKAAASDDVSDALDYAAIVTAVRELAQARSYRLLETFVEALARLIVERWKVAAVRVTVRKRALKGIGYAAVEIERRASRDRRRRPATPAKARSRR